MTDMLIDGTISKEVYDEKVLEFTRKLHTLSERRHLLEESINKQKDAGKRMSALCETLSSEQVLDEFDPLLRGFWLEALTRKEILTHTS